jgi:hypothetical protein
VSRPSLGLALALAAPLACGDSNVDGWLVDRTRVIGARVEAKSDPLRASIAPGESATVTWVIAAPSGVPHVAWATASCLPPAGTSADMTCDGPILTTGSGTADGELVPTALDVPSATDARAPELLVLGAFCTAGTPTLDPVRFDGTCGSGGGAPLLASVRVRLAPAGPNRNPTAPDGVRLGDRPLGPSDVAAGSPCDTTDLPRMAAGAGADLVYAFRAEDREPGEALVLSGMVTGGTLDGQYRAVDPDEVVPKEVRFAWTAPGSDGIDSRGRVVRLWLGLRDGRGGAAFTRFAVCVTR